MKLSRPKNRDEARKTRSGPDLTQIANFDGYGKRPCSVQFLKQVWLVLLRLFSFVGNNSGSGRGQAGLAGSPPRLSSLLQPIFLSLRHFSSSLRRSRLPRATLDRWLRWYTRTRRHPSWPHECSRTPGGQSRAALAPRAIRDRTATYIRRNTRAASG